MGFGRWELLLHAIVPTLGSAHRGRLVRTLQGGLWGTREGLRGKGVGGRGLRGRRAGSMLLLMFYAMRGRWAGSRGLLGPL